MPVDDPYAVFSDAELGQAIKKKNPGVYDDYGDEEIGNAMRVKTTPQLGEVSKQARKNLANVQADQAAAQYGQDITNAKTQFAGTVAAAVPAAALAPLTGGMSVPAAMGTMGAAGLMGGLYREGVKAAGGSTELPATTKDLVKSLALDTVMGATGEGLARGIGYATTSLAPKLLERAASKFTAGQDLLEQTFTNTRDQLYANIRAAGRPEVNVGSTISNLYDRLAKLPRGRGQFGSRFSDPTDKAASVLRLIEEDMQTAGGSVANMQPLDSLVRIKGSLQQMAYKDSGLGVEERQAFKQAALELDKSIRSGLQEVGGDAPALYDRSLQLMKTQKQHEVGVSLAESLLKRIGGKMISGAAIGGAAGYEKEHSLMGALGGAALGAAGTTALSGTLQKAVPWSLEMVMSHPQAVNYMKRAIATAIEGNEGQAKVLAFRAFGVAGVRERLKEWLAPAVVKRIDTQPPEALAPPPEAAK